MLIWSDNEENTFAHLFKCFLDFLKKFRFIGLQKALLNVEYEGLM